MFNFIEGQQVTYSETPLDKKKISKKKPAIFMRQRKIKTLTVQS